MPIRDDCDPAGRRLPIKLDSTTNGEFVPIPLDDSLRHANALAAERATGFAKRVGKSRREFLVSSCGAASTLLAFNAAHAAAGRTGGFFEVSADAALDSGIAAAELGKQEFIFDVQGHFVNPTGAWTKSLPPSAQPLRFATNRANCSTRNDAGLASLGCIGRGKSQLRRLAEINRRLHRGLAAALHNLILAKHHSRVGNRRIRGPAVKVRQWRGQRSLLRVRSQTALHRAASPIHMQRAGGRG